jgi:hypothetical protein
VWQSPPRGDISVRRVATLTPLTVAELDGSIADLRARGADTTSRSRAERRALLRALHQSLLRATSRSEHAPMASLAAAADLLEACGADVVDVMSPRPRTAFRLLLAGGPAAAWAVLIDSATGVVEDSFHASTATGAARTSPRLPLLTVVEAPKVFADLPGFRDPRFGAPDDCYDLTDIVRLRQHLDEIAIVDGAITFGGWAALDALTTSPDEQVRVIWTNTGTELSVAARRLRRPDLVAASTDAQPRRTWAGWSARLDLADPRLVDGTWALSLELDHAGVSRRAPIGASTSDLARASARGQLRVGARVLRWETADAAWSVVVSTD